MQQPDPIYRPAGFIAAGYPALQCSRCWCLLGGMWEAQQGHTQFHRDLDEQASVFVSPIEHAPPADRMPAQDIARGPEPSLENRDHEVCPCCKGDPRTVCDACNSHACWAGLFMCDQAQHAGTRQSDD